MSTPFPAGFRWGVATSGHQTEGGNQTSDTWFAEQVSPTVFAEPSGMACNSWQLWTTDLDLVAGLGLNSYRFSVEWARVEPDSGERSEAALDHYEAIVDGCLERGLEPLVTLNHFTSPHWFASRGGWLDADAPERFAEYCAAVAARFGDRLNRVITLNEPNLPRLLGWMGLPDVVRDLERDTLAAASARAGVERYRLTNVALVSELDQLEAGLLDGHTAAREAIRAGRPDLKVGLSLSVVDDRVVGADSSVRDRKRDEAYRPWLEQATDDDFVGVQNYEVAYYDGIGEVGPDGGPPQNHGLFSSVDASSLAGAVRYVHEAAHRPIVITEHGMATDDDNRRVDFLTSSLSALSEVIAEDLPVLGYYHWTLIDNFEWIFGFGPKLGLFGLDRQMFERLPKPSAEHYAKLVAHYSRGG